LHSGNPAFDALPAYFQQGLQPALRSLLDAAAAAGEFRTDIAAEDLLNAAASLIDLVEIREGEALETLRKDLPETID
ncbi:hypothetical protein AB9F39_39345, partial [Rhizobium leguminosarum]